MSAIDEDEKARRIKDRFDRAMREVATNPQDWSEYPILKLIQALSDAIAKELAHMWWTRR